MDQYSLTKQIIEMCKYFNIIDYEMESPFIEKKIIDSLDDVFFIENLLKVFYSKIKIIKHKNNLNYNKFKKLLIELEKIRLNLEFKEG